MNKLSKGDLLNAKKYLKRATKAKLASPQLNKIYNDLCAIDFNLENSEDTIKNCNKALGADKRDWKAYDSFKSLK